MKESWRNLFDTAQRNAPQRFLRLLRGEIENEYPSFFHHHGFPPVAATLRFVGGANR